MIRSRGHCNTMGTASTMALLAEALGTTLPGSPARPRRTAACSSAPTTPAGSRSRWSRRPPPEHVLSRASFHNAIVALAAIGGSTNAVVHLLAIAGRLGIELTLDDFDRIGAGVPLLVDLQPAGRFLMDDLHRAGGLLAVLREVATCSTPHALTVTGRPLVEHLDDARIWDREVIRPRAEPLQPTAGIAVLRGNLAPDGAIIKPAAASPRAAAPPRPRRRLRLDRGLPRPDRRPRPRRRRRLGPRPARLRAEGLPGHARGRQPAAAARSSSPRGCATWCASATAG